LFVVWKATIIVEICENGVFRFWAKIKSVIALLEKK
jgi:hypothetical protein